MKQCKNIMELTEYLNENLGDSSKLTYSLFALNRINGTYKNEDVSIIYDSLQGEYLLLFSSDKVINDLIPLLNEIMVSSPICKYDKVKYNKKELTVAVEWDTKHPDKRLTQIINGKAWNDSECINIELYGKNVMDYIENESDKNQNNKTDKIYGKYPGNIKDPELIKKMTSSELYVEYYNLTFELYYNKCHNPNVDMTEVIYAIEFCVYQTKKFGVNLSEPSKDKHIETDETFSKWCEKEKQNYYCKTNANSKILIKQKTN